ncbi:MAG: hypothetical protein ABI652_06790, partial [Acidobacteriota bacterium]
LGDADTIPKAAVAMASTVPAAVAVAFGFLLAWRLSANAEASLRAALALAFGTLLWPYGKFGFNAALACAALSSGVYGVGVGTLTRRIGLLAAGGAALGFAMLTRHELSLAAAVCLLWLSWQVRTDTRRIALMLAGAAGVVVAAGVSMALNVSRFGDPFFAGHRPVFSLAGALAFLISPSGALLLYSPVAVAAVALIPRAFKGDPLSLLLLLVSAVMGGFYASLDDWLGTRSYGPRYLVPLLPMLVAPFALWWTRARRPALRLALVTLSAASVLVQLPAVAVDFSRAGIAAGQPPQTERRDQWRWSPLRINTLSALEAIPANVRYFAGLEPAPAAAAPRGSSISQRVAFSLDFWWLYLFYVGAIGRSMAVALAVVPLVVAAFLLRAASRHTRACTTATAVGLDRWRQ